jgi:hypothetical protein
MSHPPCNFARSASRVLRSLPVLLLLSAAGALTPAPAKAEVTANDQAAADVAVDLFIKFGQSAGLPIDARAATFVKELVSCAVSGSKPDIGDCAKNMIIKVALKEAGTSREVQEAAICLLGGTKAVNCALDAALGKVPAEAKPMATCLVNGGAIPDCAKKLAEGLLIPKVPEDVRPIVMCMIDKGDPKACGTEFVQQQVQKNLPAGIREQAGAIVGCLNSAQAATACVTLAATPEELKPLVACAQQPGANVGACMAKFAADNLPPGTPDVAKDMIGCIGNSPDFANCAKDKGIAAGQDLVRPVISQAEKEALEAALAMLDKLRPDAPMTIEAGPNNAATLQNILKVGQGIKDKNWGLVVLGAGPELAIIASNVILSIFLTPALAAVLSPAVSAMIHNDVAAAVKAFEAAGNGNAVGLAQVVFDWYAHSFIDKPCAILGKDVQETVCGELSNVIRLISTHGGDFAKGILGEGKKILEWFGVWGLVDGVATFTFNELKNAVETVGNFLGFGGKEDEWRPGLSCGPLLKDGPQGYFANNYLACVTKATGSAMVTGTVDTSGLDSKCTADFSACIPPSKRSAAATSVAQTCGAMATQLANLAKDVSVGINKAADAYTQMGGPANYVNKLSNDAAAEGYGISSRDFCNASFWDEKEKQAYVSECATKFVNKQFPLPDTATGGPSCAAMSTSTAAARRACRNFLDVSLNAGKPPLVGPDGEYCKRQKDWAALHQCEFTPTKRELVDAPRGIWIDTQWSMKCPSPIRSGVGLGLDAFAPARPPFGGVMLPSQGGGVRKADDLMRPPILTTVPGPARGGSQGSSGTNKVHGGSGNSPTTTRPEKLKAGGAPVVTPGSRITHIKKPAVDPGLLVRRPAGSSGSNLSAGGNAAISRLTGDGMGGGFRSVGSSGSSGALPSQGRKPVGSSGSAVTTSPPMGSSGINTTSSQSGNAPIRTQQAPPPRAPSGPDRIIDYGGCGGCGKQDTVRHPR